MAKSKEPIKLVSYEDIMGIGDFEEVALIEINDIHPFKNHPFKVKDDEKMEELIKSIGDQGIFKGSGITLNFRKKRLIFRRS